MKLIDLFDNHEPNTPMDKDETKFMFIAITSNDPNFHCDIEEIDEESDLYKHFEPMIKSMIPQIFIKRLKTLTKLKISLGALILLLYHMESPGQAVMYTYYLKHKVEENTVITLNTIAEIFPVGFFSEKQLQEIWNKQKVKSSDMEGICIGAPDNMIDYIETWE